MLPSEKWFNHPERILQSVNLDEDQHAHCATWLLARVNNLIHRSGTPPTYFDNEVYLQLKNDLATWEGLGRANTKPIMRRDADHHADRPFPYVLLSNESSTIAHIMWHTAMVLFLDFESSNLMSGQTGSWQTIYEHVRTACGIIETSSSSSCILVNAVQPLWICGRHLKTKCEKFAVLELLAQIERDTGWKTRWRSDSLRGMWNLG